MQYCFTARSVDIVTSGEEILPSIAEILCAVLFYSARSGEDILPSIAEILCAILFYC